MIVLGRVIASYGLKGWLKLRAYGDNPEAWGSMQNWWMGSSPHDFSDWKCFVPEGFRRQGQVNKQCWILKLQGVNSREAAQSLCGSFVGALRQELPATEPDEYYWGDLTGLAVVNLSGVSLGKVSGLMESGAHAVMVVDEKEELRQKLQNTLQEQSTDCKRGHRVTGVGRACVNEHHRQHWLPFVNQVIKNVDLETGIVLVDWQPDW